MRTPAFAFLQGFRLVVLEDSLVEEVDEDVEQKPDGADHQRHDQAGDDEEMRDPAALGREKHFRLLLQVMDAGVPRER